MTFLIPGKIQGGKIIPEKKLPFKGGEVQIKIFVLPHRPKVEKFFGKLKGVFGDGLKYQKKIRSEWK